MSEELLEASPKTLEEDSDIIFVRERRLDFLCAQRDDIYHLGFAGTRLTEKPLRPRRPVLIKDYVEVGLHFRHVCTLTIDAYRRIMHEPLLLPQVSAALEQTFWTLVEWGIDPSYAPIRFYVSPDLDEPYHNELIMRVRIPRDAPVNWMDFWTYLDKKVFDRVPSTSLTTAVERFHYGPMPISSIREDIA